MSRTLTLPAWFDERFGADLYHCASCNYCVDAVWPERGLHHVCATLEHHSPAPGYSGRGFIDTARALLEGVALDADSIAERVFTCTTCGNCETSCPIGLRPAAIGAGFRSFAGGHRQKKSGPRPMQLGATVVIGPGDEILYEDREDYAGDHADLDEVLAVLQG